MKLIIKIIKPAKLGNIREALVEMGIQGIASRAVSGFDGQKGHKERYQGAEYAIDFPPQIKISVAMSDKNIGQSADSGKIGDGKISL